jgi:hypothetical protein
VTAARWLVLILCLPLIAAVKPADARQPAKMWDVVSSADWNLTVRSIERQPAPLIPGDESTRPAGQFAIFTVDLQNVALQPLSPEQSDFVLRSASGVIALMFADQSATDAFAVSRGDAPFNASVQPGQSATVLLIFDIRPSAFPLTLTFNPARRDIRIDECSCSLPSPVRD